MDKDCRAKTLEEVLEDSDNSLDLPLQSDGAYSDIDLPSITDSSIKAKQHTSTT